MIRPLLITSSILILFSGSIQAVGILYPCGKHCIHSREACENCSYTRPLEPYPNPFEYPDKYKVTNDSDRADPYGDVGYTFS